MISFEAVHEIQTRTLGVSGQTQKKPTWFRKASVISNFFVTLNACTNLVIYCIMNTQFRNHFIQMLCVLPFCKSVLCIKSNGESNGNGEAGGGGETKENGNLVDPADNGDNGKDNRTDVITATTYVQNTGEQLEMEEMAPMLQGNESGPKNNEKVETVSTNPQSIMEHSKKEETTAVIEDEKSQANHVNNAETK